MPRKDPFRTLDDAEPAAVPALPNCGDAPADVLGMRAAEIDAHQWLVMGALRIPLRRPGWARRALVRLVLGWRYDA